MEKEETTVRSDDDDDHHHHHATAATAAAVITTAARSLNKQYSWPACPAHLLHFLSEEDDSNFYQTDVMRIIGIAYNIEEKKFMCRVCPCSIDSSSPDLLSHFHEHHAHFKDELKIRCSSLDYNSLMDR